MRGGAVNTDCAVCSVNMSKCVGVEPEPEPRKPRSPPRRPSRKRVATQGMLLAVLAVALVGGRRRSISRCCAQQQKAAAPQEDYGDELTDYDEPDGYGDEDDDGPPWDEEGDDGEEGKMRFTNSPMKMMMQKPRPKAPAPAKPPRGSGVPRVPTGTGSAAYSATGAYGPGCGR